jgi:hypothetical protein
LKAERRNAAQNAARLLWPLGSIQGRRATVSESKGVDGKALGVAEIEMRADPDEILKGFWRVILPSLSRCQNYVKSERHD